MIITSSGQEKEELSQKVLDVLYATEVAPPLVLPYTTLFQDGFAIPDESEIPEEF